MAAARSVPHGLSELWVALAVVQDLRTREALTVVRSVAVR